VHPVERSHISRVEAAAGMRLACQLVAKRDLRIVLPPEVLAAHEVLCRVRSNRNVATFIKEVVLELPEGESFEARAGSYIQVECPPYQLDYADIEVDARFERSWAQGGLRKLHAGTAVPATRAYSLASYPEERGLLMLNVRIATPPPDRPDVPPGVVSSYVFGLRAGDEVSVSGPFGTFFAQETDREMVFVGGGAGMAPMRALILDQLKRLGSKRRIGYWYGARSLSEAFYVELFEQLQREHDNFRWHLALSEPLPEDAWQGDTGFIHQVVLDRYLAQHPAPEDVEYYLCGPPPMVEATLHMLRELGVRADNIRYDVF
jgi:Na+-transporting NADH:ubiquinone oxidoreductase subunit F